jgi:hypothetical protein
MVKSSVLFLFLACGLFAGCSDGDSTDPADESTGGSGGSGGGAPGPIEIEGEWTSDFGTESIDDDSWEGGGSTAIVEYSNAENYAVFQNPDDAMYFPGMFGRNVWTEIADDSFYYCTVAYMSESADATEDDAQPFDDSDPDNGGCGDGGYPWTKLTRQ